MVPVSIISHVGDEVNGRLRLHDVRVAQLCYHVLTA